MHSPLKSWYVQINGQTYGPYSAAQMQGFCAEGRITEYSIISQSAVQGYAYARQFQSFFQWTGQLQAVQPLAQAQTPVQNQLSSPTPAQVLRPISAPQTSVLARQITPVDNAPAALAPNPTPQVQPAPLQSDPVQPALELQTTAKTVFIVMAEIRSSNGMNFLQALQGQGLAQRIGDSVWLLKSETRVEQLRNVLSQTLTGDDRLFLLDSFANKTAWFNIGTDMDARIRQLWDLDH